MRSKALKRVTAFATAFIMSLGTISVLPADSFTQFSFTAFAEGTVVESGQCGDNVYYELDSEGMLTISGEGEMYKYDWYYRDNPSPLYENKEIKSVTISSGVTSIGDEAFYGCESLTNITIPDSVTLIGDEAFYGCESLTNITIPESVASIGRSAFRNCKSLTNITIPDSVTSIEYYTFYCCTGLTSITIPDGVTTIEYRAFYCCVSLTSITIPDSVTSIEEGAFYCCESLTNITIPESVASIGHSAFLSCKSLTNITIPDSVTSIEEEAFYGCSSLTSITIPDSVTSIEDEAFYGCESLTNITIPESVTSIGRGAFRNCKSLTNITIPDSVTSIGDSTFYGCTNLTSITIPDSVTSIGDSTFYGCTNLTSITIPDSVTSIGYVAFCGCESLTNITIPDSFTSIGSGVFEGCTGLTSITIPDSVTSIEMCAFSGCTSLTSITIPDSVTSIGFEAFEECTGLTSITIPDSVTSIEMYAFSGCTSLTSITIPDGVTSIEKGTFRGCSSLTSITIPDSVTSIGAEAFFHCESLTNITIPDSVTSIGDFAFRYCSSLTSITIPDSVTSIGYEAFYGCESLTNITIPDSVTSIGGYAFAWCEKITSITIPDSVTSIGDEAFLYCDNLTIYGYTGSYAETYANFNNIPFVALDGTDTPSDPTETPIEAFEIVKNYDDPTGETYKIIGYKGTDENVVIPASSAEGDIISIYKFVFNGNTVKSVTLSKNITDIDLAAFSNATALENIYVNENNTAFKAQDGILYNYDMTKLLCYPEGRTSTEFTVPDTVTTIGSFAMSNIDLNKLVIGKNVTQIEQSAFFSSDFTIYGYKNSYAETYAKENNIPFVALDGENTEDPDPDPDPITCDHTFSTTYSHDALRHWYECTKCHSKDLTSYTLHSFGESVVTKEPTETETGISKETCKYCGYISKKEIPCLSNTIYVNEGESYTVTALDAGKDIVVNGGKLTLPSEYASYSFGALTVNSGDAFIRGGKFRAIGVNGGTLSVSGDVTVNESVYVVGGEGKLFGSDVKGGTMNVSAGSLSADKLVISEYGVFTMSGCVVDAKEFEFSTKYNGSIFAGGTLWIKDSFTQKNEKFSASDSHTTIFYGASKKTVNYKDAVFGKLWLTESADYDHVNLYKVLSSKNAPCGIWQCNDSGTKTIKDLSAEYLIDGDPNMIGYEDYSVELMTDLYNAYKAKDPNSQSLFLSAVTVSQPVKQSFPESYRNNAKPAYKGYYIDFYMPEYISRMVSLCSYIFESEYVSGEDGVQINEIIFKINDVDVGVNSKSNLRNVDIAFKVSGFSMSDGSFNTVQAAFYEGGTRNLIGCGIYSINASHTAFKDYAIKITNRLKSKSENWIKSYIKALLKDYKINPSVSNLTLNAVKKAAGSEKDIIELFEKMFKDIKQYQKFLDKTNNVKSTTAFKSDIIDRLGNIEFISSSSKAYKDLYVYCPVDIYVYDEQMRLVGSIVNNVVDPSSEIDMYTEGDKKHFTLDADKKVFHKICRK